MIKEIALPQHNSINEALNGLYASVEKVHNTTGMFEVTEALSWLLLVAYLKRNPSLPSFNLKQLAYVIDIANRGAESKFYARLKE